MRIIIVGPGRAGASLALAADAAGHELVGVFTRRADDLDLASALDIAAHSIGDPMPPADLLVLSVRDDAINDVATRIAHAAGSIPAAIHLSGLASVDALRPLAESGLAVGSFHPLRSLPDPQTGARALAGAPIAITATEPLAGALSALAQSIGAEPFDLDDEAKPLYHAAAAASANYVTAALAMAESLFERAGVDHGRSRPLVEGAIANAYELGASAALTGPIARGDIGTVRAQIEAIDERAPHLSEAFKAFGRVTAELAGTGDQLAEVLR